jgi:hypothetical protein
MTTSSPCGKVSFRQIGERETSKEQVLPNVRESVLAHAVFFDNIIELIPAKHYLPVDEERVRSQQPRRANSGHMSRQHPNILGLACTAIMPKLGVPSRGLIDAPSLART